MNSPKRYALVVTITVELGEAPDARTLRDAGLSDLTEYADHLLADMDLDGLFDAGAVMKARRRAVEIDEEGGVA